MNGPQRHRQLGAAALVVTLLLVMAMLIVVAAVNRNAAVELRSAASNVRSAQAFEAAEAGLEWALARLNDETRVGDDCLPSGDPAAASFRDLHLRDDGRQFVVATWDDAGTPAPRQAACVRTDDGWSCRCAEGAPALDAPEGTATAPLFAVHFEAGPRPGLVRAIAIGCTRSDAACTASTDADHEAAARVEALFGLVPALRSAPVAALTVRGNFDAGGASLGLHNGDAASGGIAVHAGGTVAGTALRLTAPAGSGLENSIVASDARLAALSADRFFARWFGMDRRRWLEHPAAARIDCAIDCAAQVAATAAAGHRLFGVEGDLSLDGPLALGTAERPVALVVTGALRLRGAIVVDGIVAASSVGWRDAGPDATLRGALLADGDYGGDAGADVIRDPRVLAKLQRAAGSFARVNGSWKDF